MRWNEPFQKLATCDTDGGIFVWIQYEGRWSVELVNDRGAQVKKKKTENIKTEMGHELNQQLKVLCLLRLVVMHFALTQNMQSVHRCKNNIHENVMPCV